MTLPLHLYGRRSQVMFLRTGTKAPYAKLTSDNHQLTMKYWAEYWKRERNVHPFKFLSL